jgi:hypothetical protein
MARRTLAERRALQVLLAALDSPDTAQSDKIEIAKRLLDYSTAAAARVNARERIRRRTREHINEADPPSERRSAISLEKF